MVTYACGRSQYALVGLLICMLVVSCSSPQPEAGQKRVFRYNEPGGITSLDPAFASNVENIWAVQQIYNGLVQMSNDLTVEPSIAKRWEQSADGLTFVFHLRDDVFFHRHRKLADSSRTLVKASDFEYSFGRIVDPAVASYGRNLIVDYLDKSESTNYRGFKAVDDTTFLIQLKQPMPTLLGILTMPYFSVVPKAVVAYYQKDFRRNAVGTGPFRLRMWKEGVKLILNKNDDYFEREGAVALPHLDGVAISFVKDPQIAFLDFLKGNYDFASGVSPVYREELLTGNGELKEPYRTKLFLQKQPYLKVDYIGMNVAGKKIKQKFIRKALMHAIDRDKLVRYLRRGVGIPARAGFVPPALLTSRFLEQAAAYDLPKAALLLNKSGYFDQLDPEPLVLYSTDHFQAVCEFLQHELTALGMLVEIVTVEPAAYREMVAQGKVDFFCKSWVADYPDASNFLGLFYSKHHAPHGANYTRFSHPKFDQWYEAAMGSSNESKRSHYFRMMDSLIVEEAPVIPLFYDESVRFVHANIKGLSSNSMNTLSLKHVRKIDVDRL